MNRTNVQRTIDYLRALPPEAPDFDMSTWFRPRTGSTSTDVEVIARRGHECGTSACLAGHIAFKFRDEITDKDVEFGAAEFLGVDNEQANNLFYVYFRDKDVSPDLDDVTVEDVIAELERMLQHG